MGSISIWTSSGPLFTAQDWNHLLLAMAQIPDVSTFWRGNSGKMSVTFGGVVGAGRPGKDGGDGTGAWVRNAKLATPSGQPPTARQMQMPNIAIFETGDMGTGHGTFYR